MQQIAREKSKGKDPFHIIHIDCLEDAVVCYERAEDVRFKMVAGPGFKRDRIKMRIIRQVLEEGEQKTPEELLQPVIRVISEQDAALIDNEQWRELQRRFAKYNEDVKKSSSKIEIRSLDELLEYVSVAAITPDNPKFLSYHPHLQKAKAIKAITDAYENDLREQATTDGKSSRPTLTLV
ncbi:MAG: hypothetical protein ABW072_11700 [Sedimenticola sp.]